MAMPHLLTVELPTEVYEPLLREAERTGREPAELAARWLACVAGVPMDDPFAAHIGAYRSEVTGVAAEHDRYLGEAIRAG